MYKRGHLWDIDIVHIGDDLIPVEERELNFARAGLSLAECSAIPATESLTPVPNQS